MIMQPPYDVTEGLSSSQVEERVRKGLINGEQEIKTKSFKEIFLANILTPFNLLNVCLAVLDPSGKIAEECAVYGSYLQQRADRNGAGDPREEADR